MRAAKLRARRPWRAKAQGFTLVELLTVVAITGILATIGTVMVRKHFADAKAGEAVAIIQALRSAQEGRRAETGLYLDCSVIGPWYPQPPNGKSRAWKDPLHPDKDRWQLLNVSRPEGTRFGFLLNAGLPGVQPPTPVTASDPTWAVAADPWYVIEATGDGDKVHISMLASSLNGELQVERDD